MPSLDRSKADCGLARVLAERLRSSREALAARWVDEIVTRDGFQPPRPPSRDMVGDMPLLIDGIAWHLEHPDDCLATDDPVIKKAMELGKLRHAQGFSERDILEEYELLGRLLFDELAAAGGPGDGKVDEQAMLACGSLLFHAIVVIEITTTTHFLEIAADRVAEREERLHAFNRAVSHEIKDRLATVANASELLDEKSLPIDRRRELTRMIARNAEEMSATVDNLLVLARVEDDPIDHPRVPLRVAIDRAMQHVAGTAATADVGVRVVGELPDVQIDDAAVYLSLLNYLRNAIKYADAGAPDRRVEIRARIERGKDDEQEVVVHVADNGIGVPPNKREGLFQRFFRAHEGVHQSGTGLGLSIVRASVRAIGGRAWADFPDKGSVFSFAVPLHATRVTRGGPRAPWHTAPA